MEKMFDSLHGEVLANLAIDKKFHSLIKPCFQRGYARLTAVQADKKNKDYYRQLQTLQDIYWHDAREIENKMKNTRAHDLLDMVRAYAGYARKHEIVIPRFHSKSVSSYMEMISMPNHNFRN